MEHIRVNKREGTHIACPHPRLLCRRSDLLNCCGAMHSPPAIWRAFSSTPSIAINSLRHMRGKRRRLFMVLLLLFSTVLPLPCNLTGATSATRAAHHDPSLPSLFAHTGSSLPVPHCLSLIVVQQDTAPSSSSSLLLPFPMTTYIWGEAPPSPPLLPLLEEGRDGVLLCL